MFTVAVVPVDAAGEAIVTIPEGFNWSTTATGPVTYASDEYTMGTLLALDPVAGSYRLDVELSDIAAAQMSFSELHCSYMVELDNLDTLELDLQYQVDGAWYVDVRAQHVTSCVFMYEVTGPLPDPSFELTGLMVLPGENTAGDRVNVGEESDWAVALVAADGSTAGTVRAGEKIQVPPGEYTPQLVASSTAQAGFDPSAWRSDGWNCLASEHLPYGSTLTLEAGGVVACNTAVSDAYADVSALIDHSDEVHLDWDGVNGAVGTEFDMVVEIQESMLERLNRGAIDPLRLALTMGDNVALVDPAGAPEGWTLDSAADGTYDYTLDAPFAPGQKTTVTFRAVLTAAKAGSAVRVCAITGVVELDRRNNCAYLEAVADGEDQDPPVEEPPVDEPPVDEPPVDEPPVEEPPVEEPPVEEPPVEDPNTEEPDEEEPQDEQELARTGGDAEAMVTAGIAAAGAIALGGVLLTRRPRRG